MDKSEKVCYHDFCRKVFVTISFFLTFFVRLLSLMKY